MAQGEPDPRGTAPPIVRAQPPALPTGGGAMRSIGEKFSANAATGTGGLSVPIAVTPARGLQPDLVLAYDSGAGNGPFGTGWHLGVPSIRRTTDKQLPTYDDDDGFVMAGAEDLVPSGNGRYRPRVEGGFARIERIGDAWRTTTAGNVTSWFGSTAASRIADPRDPSRVFAWLIDRTDDALGNVVVYEYVAEDLANVAPSAGEVHRLDGSAPIANRYLKRIRYGNTTPGDPASCLFEVVLDYGDHAGDTPDATSGLWPVRADAFSSYRAGFEIRTYRLCRRVMMFHRIPELSPGPYLVGSTVFTYDDDPALAHLRAVEQRAHRDGVTQAIPAVRLHYTEATPGEATRVLASDPVALDGADHQWVDLDGEGIPGVLSDTGGALYYRRNLGAGVLAPARALVTRPATTALAGGDQHLMDVGGDGRLDLVELAGFHERVPTADGEGDWAPFQPFAQQPVVAWSDPDARFIDLDGDGREDLLIVCDDKLVWYPSLGKDGFGPPRTLPRPLDEERGPTVVFSDRTGTIALADLAGDGLRSFVRVENGRICYWPNLGHGRFGAKVTMANAPIFDAPDQFEPKRVLFADIDGTGASDVLYARRDGVRYWRNLAGNAWSEAHDVAALPPDVRAASITAVDLLGSGTACLVWSSSAPADSTIYYVELSTTKPHLLDEVDNQLGLVTRVRYAPSTKFYLADRAAGIHWKTQLPFPVHVIERVESYDAIRRVRFVSEYRYRDGYYDGYERELRGFGYVEQRDTESVGAALGAGLFADRPPPTNNEYPQPPVVTKTWFHTGVWLEGDTITVPADLTTAESRDAYRALRGLPLRVELADDAGAPYTVTEHGYAVRCLQRAGDNAHGVFHAHARETLAWHYERDLTDPRITHEVVLDVDDHGHVRRRAAIGYPRSAAASDVRPEQTQLLATLVELDVANEVDHPDWYRHGAPLETRTYQLTGLPPGMLTPDAVAAVAAAAVAVAYDAAVPPGPCKRLVERSRTRYYDSAALPAPLPFGAIDARALVYETYGLVFTETLLASLFGGRVTDALLAEGGYVQDGDGWWVPSGRSVPDAAQFYRPTHYIDPFGNTTTVGYDAHALVATTATDALGNTTSADIDYRMLTPFALTDPNGAMSHVELDVLGRVTKLWHSGRGEGDLPTGEPTVELDYGFYDGTRPSFVHRRARETHADPDTRWQRSYSYCDGTGREIAKKVQAESGKAMQLVDGQCVEVDANPRWVGSGRTVLDNKGNPVKQYEPYFSVTSDYDDEAALVCAGVTPLLHYDPLGRLIRTERPDGATTRVEHTPWQQATYDANDTLAEPGNVWLARMQAGTPAEQRAATLALAHAGTPAITLFDTLGRAFAAIADTKAELLETRTQLDIEGNALVVIDPLGRAAVMRGFSMLGQACHAISIDAGERWTLVDAAGRPLRMWEADRVRSFSYDALHRPTEVRVAVGGAAPIVVEHTIYGEDAPDPSPYLRGRIYQTFDGAGVATVEAYDFAGNAIATTRQLAVVYDAALDWSTSVALEAEVFRTTASYDALGRLVRADAPDGSITWRGYNAASLLETVEVQLRGAPARTTFVANIDYDAKGQRTQIDYGAGATTSYEYDPLTFRMARLHTVRAADGAVLQDLAYTYDAQFNIVEIFDAAQQSIYHANAVAEPRNQYTYDAINRLISATGREHLGQLPEPTWDDAGRTNRPHPNDEPMRPYTEHYSYDGAGNFLELAHEAIGGDWQRSYTYGGTNRLSTYAHDASGNITAMPHLPLMRWDAFDRLQATARQVVTNGGTPETTYYAYDSAGVRVRKVTDRQAAAGATPARKSERIYLGGYEIYREYGATQTLERQTLHVMDDGRRIALVESRTSGDDGSPAQLVRYQLGNHLGSSAIELDATGAVISYEEYYPYGSTSFQSVRSQTEAPKRYRYTAKERDEETGFSYHGARYYAPWLGRWTAVDPAGRGGARSPYAYVGCNPLAFVDPDGRWEFPWEEKPKRLEKHLGSVAQTIVIQADVAMGAPVEKIQEDVEKYKQVKRDEDDYNHPAPEAPKVFGVDVRDLARAMAPNTFQNVRRNDPLANQKLPPGIKQQFGGGAQDDVAVKGANVAKDTFKETAGWVLPAETNANVALALVNMMVDPSKETATSAAINVLFAFLPIGKIAKRLLRRGPATAEVVLQASQSKIVREAAKDTLKAAGKVLDPDHITGVAAEITAGWVTNAAGHEVLGAIQKTGEGHGIDLVTKIKGIFYVWEVKGNGARFTPIQERMEFVLDRVREAIDHPEKFSAEAVALAKDVYEALRTGHVEYRGFRVKGL